MLLGALEAGGTKMVLAIGDGSGHIADKVSIPTTEPDETMAGIVSYFQKNDIKALGVGCFGPLDLKTSSPTYGYITSTPKLKWRNFPLVKALEDGLHVPVALDTDVNGAALAESTLGAARGLLSCLYVTVGTGIGGGLVVEGNLVHGLLHPEFGHMLLRPQKEDPSPEGFCPYHGSCLEGLACGPAMERRWGMPARELNPDHPAWKLEANYLAQMCVNAIVSFSPEKIILGGGVMQQHHLFPLIRKETLKLLGGYVQHPAILNGMEDYIVPPGLQTESGIQGAFLLAKRALDKGSRA
jgi:fructokinase